MCAIKEREFVFSLEGQQLWAVGRHEDDSHKYLLVSRTRSTLILELGAEMVELEEPIFITAEPTVAAGELADGGMAVQVTFDLLLFDLRLEFLYTCRFTSTIRDLVFKA